MPIAWVLDANAQPTAATAVDILHMASDRITSFIVPFAGPHNCVNSKTCPNRNTATGNNVNADANMPTTPPSPPSPSLSAQPEAVLDETLTPPPPPTTPPAYDPCPFPTKVLWWQTRIAEDDSSTSAKHRAIVGYSDGTVCIVNLEPHCPLVAHTSIERNDGVDEMVTCRDNVMNSMTLIVSISCTCRRCEIYR